MKTIILGKTSNEKTNVIWANVDGVEYGINEDFDVNSLQSDGSNCDCIDSESISEYHKIASSIEDAAKNTEINFI